MVTEVIYNAECPICAREIDAYRRYAQRRDLPVTFVALDSADAALHGLSEEDAARRLHVVRAGELLAGVPAFIALWEEMPRFRWLARVLRWPGVRQVATLVYEGVLAPALYALHRRRRARRVGAGRDSAGGQG